MGLMWVHCGTKSCVMARAVAQSVSIRAQASYGNG